MRGSQNRSGGQHVLQLLECFIGLRGLGELLRFIHQLIQRNCFFSQPTEESAEGSQATGELLHLLQIFGLLHSLDCGYLLGIAFDSSLGNEKSQDLAGWYTKNTFLWVELDLVSAQICECPSEVVQECGSLDRLYHQIIHIDVQIYAELGVSAPLNCALVSGTSVLQ